jgi:hypothetical protein
MRAVADHLRAMEDWTAIVPPHSRLFKARRVGR